MKAGLLYDSETAEMLFLRQRHMQRHTETWRDTRVTNDYLKWNIVCNHKKGTVLFGCIMRIEA